MLFVAILKSWHTRPTGFAPTLLTQPVSSQHRGSPSLSEVGVGHRFEPPHVAHRAFGFAAVANAGARAAIDHLAWIWELEGGPLLVRYFVLAHDEAARERHLYPLLLQGWPHSCSGEP